MSTTNHNKGQVAGEILGQRCRDLQARCEKLIVVRKAAQKLAQCFPPDKERGKAFDIPRYIIDELEDALKESK